MDGGIHAYFVVVVFRTALFAITRADAARLLGAAVQWKMPRRAFRGLAVFRDRDSYGSGAVHGGVGAEGNTGIKAGRHDSGCRCVDPVYRDTGIADWAVHDVGRSVGSRVDGERASDSVIRRGGVRYRSGIPKSGRMVGPGAHACDACSPAFRR